MTPEDIAAAADVSRETLDRLATYVELLLRWNARINLVGRGTEADIWRRHVLDGLQLLPLAPPEAESWIDLGSGAGIPGLVVAIAAAGREPPLRVELVESDQRKAAFLATAIREVAPGATLHARRIGDVAAAPRDVVSARALAPLGDLLGHAARFRGPATICLFPKGRNVVPELTEARRRWHVEAEQHRSISDPQGTVLSVRHFEARA